MNIDFEKIKLLEDLEFHREDYLFFKDKNEKLCEPCIEWESLDLPYDCLSKPAYCLRNSDEILFIINFEEAEEMLRKYKQD